MIVKSGHTLQCMGVISGGRRQIFIVPQQENTKTAIDFGQRIVTGSRIFFVQVALMIL